MLHLHTSLRRPFEREKKVPVHHRQKAIFPTDNNGFVIGKKWTRTSRFRIVNEYGFAEQNIFFFAGDGKKNINF
jgi:hypothetical protein